MVEVVGGAAVVSVTVLELAKVVEGIDLLEGDLDASEGGSEGEGERAYIVVFLQILKILVLVLAESLCDLWVGDNIKDGLSFLLEAFVGGKGVFPLAGELCAR